MNKIQTEEFDLAYKFVTETDSNIFLTGKAGTGKTTFLRYLKEKAVKNMAIAAPTGVAAINAGGVTLHSMFQLPFGPFIPSFKDTTHGYDKKNLISRLRYNSKKISFFRTLELLVIDEASMVPAYTVDAVDTILRSVRHNQAPFGGVQVLFIGDLHQLQPVLKKEEWEMLKEYYESIFFFDSHVLKNHAPVMIELKKIFRQKDEKFIEILNGIRENTLKQKHVEELNKRMKRGFISADHENYITLTTHNNQAESINRAKLSRLEYREIKFYAKIEGEFPEQMYPAEKELVLKKNAQVMFIKNDLDGKKYFNGKIGVVTEISDDKIVVNTDGVNINVTKVDWKNLTYTVNPASKQIEENVIGEFLQYPLRLAWAITIHKSQGLTFDKVVIDAENAFANGQVYVALSRATSLEGLIISSPVNDQFLGAHSDLIRWQEKHHDESSLPQRFENAKQKFMKERLFNIFSFDSFTHALNNLRKETKELNDETVIMWLQEFSHMNNEINAISIKFKKQLDTLFMENPDITKNEKLNARIKDAAVYFLKQLEEMNKNLIEHPIKVSTRVVSRKVDNDLEEINEHLLFAKTKLKLCSDGFRFNELVAWKKSVPEKYDKIKSSYFPSSEKLRTASHENLFDLISEFRKKLAEEKDVELYRIFPNSAIKNLCEFLPGDTESLLAIPGFGKHKVREFGEDIVRIICDYCEDNKIVPNHMDENKDKKLPFERSFKVSDTVKQTIDLFKSGKDIPKICEVRNLKPGTIENHLAEGIKNRLINIDQVISKEELEKIASFFIGDSLELTAAKEKSGEDISFSKLRLVQAWLISERIDAK